jgi:hypothetical protein
MASKLDLAAILAAIACGVLIIEHAHQTFTDLPMRTERSNLAAAACPDNDNMPYSAGCLAFLEGELPSQVRRGRAAERAPAAPSVASKQIDASIAPEAECPAMDNVPYSASCIAFLSGWFWQPNTSESAIGAARP